MGCGLHRSVRFGEPSRLVNEHNLNFGAQEADPLMGPKTTTVFSTLDLLLQTLRLMIHHSPCQCPLKQCEINQWGMVSRTVGTARNSTSCHVITYGRSVGKIPDPDFFEGDRPQIRCGMAVSCWWCYFYFAVLAQQSSLMLLHSRIFGTLKLQLLPFEGAQWRMCSN